MRKKIIKVVKGIASQIALSLFFSAFFIVGVYFTIGNTLSNVVFLVNRVVIVETKAERQQIRFDSVKKRLINYPNYGEVWATINIPKIGVSAIVYHGDSMKLLQTGTGHYAGSYFPGEGGTVLIAAHNSSQHFGKIPTLEIGDQIIIKAEYGTYTYEVTDGTVMKATELEKMEFQSRYEELVLYTCYPVTTVGYKTDRYVIHAKLVGEKYED